MVMPT
jgi:hypothetical protein